MSEMPDTPDFDFWPVHQTISKVAHAADHVTLHWSDGKTCQMDAVLLRENCPAPETTHRLSREMVIAPTDIPAELRIKACKIDAVGALCVHWMPEDVHSRYHPGWLRAHSYFDETTHRTSTCVLWNAASQPVPPTFDGPTALGSSKIFLSWLEALRDYGVSRLENLPLQDGMLEDVAQRVGSIRETNFGRIYTLAIKDVPDSNAFTSLALPQHIDLPTRETPPGLQFLFCRANTTSGGEGSYCDAYKIAEDIRTNDPDIFESLITDVWHYNNRAKTTDYRASGPLVELDSDGAISSVRFNTWLRSPMRAPLDIQSRAYRAYRHFTAMAQSPTYQMKVDYRAGDLFAFDNRRALHGRRAYDAGGGERYIEGVYSDRDELYSRIRILGRRMRAQH